MTKCLSFCASPGEAGTLSPENVFPRMRAHSPASFPQRCPGELGKSLRCLEDLSPWHPREDP